MQIHQKSFLIYKYVCKCNVGYIGCMTQQLDIRINQHIPSHICNNTLTQSIVPGKQCPPSAIAQHVLASHSCTCGYNQAMFLILESSNEFHLSILKALLINKFKPELCKQNYFTHLSFSAIHLEQRKLILLLPILLGYGKNSLFFSLPSCCPQLLSWTPHVPVLWYKILWWDVDKTKGSFLEYFKIF